ncbi:MAG: sigma-70 family RNA polymerase sigma factor [Gemmiger sp.]|nr:sigma-70 family RNA polymerase sigma factor [Gemmiger sp.]
MTLFKNKPLAALRQVYEASYTRLCAAAAALPGVDAHMAQDAVQEAWLRLTRPALLPRLDPDPARLQGLLLVTVCNTARNLRRAAAGADLPGEDTFALLSDPTPGPAEQAEKKDAAAALRRLVAALPEPDKSILLLQYGQGCTGAEIATLLQLNETAVRQRAHRARARLKQALEKEGYTGYEG